MVISLERGANLHMAQLKPLPLTVSCFSTIQFGFAFLVPAHPGSPGKKAVYWSYCSLILSMEVVEQRSGHGLTTFCHEIFISILCLLKS